MSLSGPSSLSRTRNQKAPVYHGRRSQSSDSDSSSELNTSFSSTSADEEKNRRTKSSRRKYDRNVKSKYSSKNSSGRYSSDDSSDQHSSHDVMVTRSSIRNKTNKNSTHNSKTNNSNENNKKRNWSTNDDDSDSDQSDYESYSNDSDRSHSEEISEEDSEPHIQLILGVQENSTNQDDDDNEQQGDINANLDDEDCKYYVKWTNLSYIHCTWLTSKEISSIPGGEAALRKFKKKTFNDELSPSTSIPSLLTASQDDLNANWFRVERIIGHRVEEISEEDENNNNDHKTIEQDQYLVKWKSLPYDQCTWENEDDISEKSFIEDYNMRSHHWNSTIFDKKSNRSKGKFKNYEYEDEIENDNNNDNNNTNNSNDPKNAEKNENSSSSFIKLIEPLADKSGNVLRPYQLEGLNWLRYCWQNGNNSILADEMGLGKTVQIVSVLNDIATNHNITGPFIIIAPLTTLPQWKNEFERWSNLNAIIYQGSPKSREIIEEYEFPSYNESGNVIKNAVSFDALITNYETFATNFDKLKEIEWRYLVLDEGHRLKNHAGKCYQLLLNLTYEHCTLLTGTPIQNNVEELWSLLHLLHPDKFNNLPQFLEQFGNIDNIETLRNLQNLIRPYILRRKKNDVETSIAAKEETIIEVELTRIQKTYYRALLLDNTSTLLQQITGGSLPSLLNLMMQLRKVCNHPFLIKGAKENIEMQIASKLPPETSQDDIELDALIDSSGKMILIDKLLPKLQNDGHKVLIFSQMVKVLDIIEDYLIRKDYTFERIDGSVPEIEREAAIERFSSQEDIFIFLLCTKAGGVGINLTAADTVIIFDSDWNPQNDVQAQSRCHRIGQRREVKVYRLVTRGTYELQMLDRASKKLGLDHALLDGGELNRSQPMAAKEIEKLLRQGAYNIAHDDDTEIDNFCAADIDQILERHSKKMSSNDNGQSLFNKAKFDPENDSLDMNAADFWLQVLPSVSSLNNDEITQKRRCRKDHPSNGLNQMNSSSDDDEDDSAPEKVVRSKKTSPVSIRGTIKNLLSTGLGDSPYQRAILHQAALFMLFLLSDEDKECIQKMLNIDDIKEPSEEIKTALAEFSSNLNDVRERKTSIVRRCILFYKLDSLIKKLQCDVNLWPPSDFTDPMLDYAVLLAINKNGIGDGALLVSSLQSLGIIGASDFNELKKIREKADQEEEEEEAQIEDQDQIQTQGQIKSENLKTENNNNNETSNDNDNENGEIDDDDENGENGENNENEFKNENRFLVFDDFSLDQLEEGIVDDSILDDLKQISLKSLEKKISNLIDTLNLQLKKMGINEVEEDIEILNPIEWKKAHPKLYSRNELNNEEYQSLFQTISQYGLPRKQKYYLKNKKKLNEKLRIEDDKSIEKVDEIVNEDDENELNLNFYKNNIYINCNEVDWERVLLISKLTCVSVEAIAKAGDEIAAFGDEDESSIFSISTDSSSNKENQSTNEPNENDNENETNESNETDKTDKDKEKDKEAAKEKKRRKRGERKSIISDEIQEKAAHILPIISKLGSYGTRPWQRKLRNSIRDIEKVRSFAPTFVNDIDMIFLKRVKQYDAIDWWEPKHDLALINAISEYGQLLVTTWVVDPNGPFREHINTELVEEFEKAAEIEKQKGKQCKPKELGDMAFIFKDKLRITRALLVVRFVETHRERYIEKQYVGTPSVLRIQKQIQNVDTDKVSTANNNNNSALTATATSNYIYNENDEFKSLVKNLKINNSNSNSNNSNNSNAVGGSGLMIRTPLNLNQNLVLMNLGVFYSKDSLYPSGYVSRCKYYSTIPLRNVPSESNSLPFTQIWYEESVVVDSSNITIFTIKMLSHPYCIYSGSSPDSVWQNINSTLEMSLNEQLRSQQMAIQMPMQPQFQMVDNLKTLKSQIVDGVTLFGFNDPFVIDCFKKMKAMMHNVVPVPQIIHNPIQRNQLQMPILQSSQQNQNFMNHQQFPQVQIQQNHPLITPNILIKQPTEPQQQQQQQQVQDQHKNAQNQSIYGYQKVQPIVAPQFHIDYPRPIPIVDIKQNQNQQQQQQQNQAASSSFQFQRNQIINDDADKSALSMNQMLADDKKDVVQQFQVTRRVIDTQNHQNVAKIHPKRIQVEPIKQQLQQQQVRQVEAVGSEKPAMKFGMLLVDGAETKSANAAPSPQVLVKHKNRNIKTINAILNNDTNQNQT